VAGGWRWFGSFSALDRKRQIAAVARGSRNIEKLEAMLVGRHGCAHAKRHFAR
jgi:hypothetical protein